jgi:hypothetical protein
VASELGLPTDPGARRISADELRKTPLVIDVFRKSDANSPLGDFRAEYVAALVPESSLPEIARARIAERRFQALSRLEFVVLSRGDRPFRLMLASIGSSAPNGDFHLGVISRTTRLEGEDGPSVPVSIPFPWLESSAIPDDPMTWGLWMTGGYFVQATSYYADLGLPAVNGGVHLAFPDAMDLYTLVQESPTAIRVHAANSPEAAARLAALADDLWLLPRIDESRIQIAEIINLEGPEVHTLGHGWVDPLTGDILPAVWPKCGGFDCFRSWKVARPGPLKTARHLTDDSSTSF